MDRLRRLPLPLVALLLAAATMARAMLPAGWMPTAQEGGFRIALCGDAGAALVLGTDGRLRKEQPPSAVPRESCPFALAATALLPTFPAPVLPPLLRAEPLAPAELAALRLSSILRLRPPGRAPPVLA